MKKTIIFGAGADQSLGLSSGKDFALKVMGIDTPDMNSAIKSYYSNYVDDWYPYFKNYKWKKDDMIEAAIRKKYLDEKFDAKKEYEAKVKSKRKNIKESEASELMQYYTSYMGLIDEKFHTLISPKILGQQKFWGVISCYTRAYLLLVKEILYGNTEIKADDYKKILENPSETLMNIKRKAKEKDSKKNYYSMIRSRKNINIITTNYTPLCSILSDRNQDDIAYVHGRFGLFESPYELHVYDVEREKLPKTLLFPYIFIQSGIKPIVDRRQIKEYNKMIDYLDNSDELIVIGYRLNPDDNHLNGIIRDYMRNCENNVLTYFDFDCLEDNILYDRLRMTANMKHQFKHIQIDENNCFSRFKEYLEDGQ